MLPMMVGVFIGKWIRSGNLRQAAVAMAPFVVMLLVTLAVIAVVALVRM